MTSCCRYWPIEQPHPRVEPPRHPALPHPRLAKYQPTLFKPISLGITSPRASPSHSMQSSPSSPVTSGHTLSCYTETMLLTITSMRVTPLTIHYILSPTYYPLHSIHYILYATYYALRTMHYIRSATYYPLHFIHYILYDTYYALHSMHYIRSATYYPLHSIHYILYATYYALHTLHYIRSATYYPLHIMHYILYTTYYAQHIMHYIPYTTYYAQHTVQYILYTTYYPPRRDLGLGDDGAASCCGAGYDP